MNFDIWSFVLGVLISGAALYSTSFVTEAAKSHLNKLENKIEKRKVNTDTKKIINFLKRSRGHHSLKDIRNNAFGENSNLSLSYIENLLYRSFEDSRNVGKFEGTDWWFYTN